MSLEDARERRQRLIAALALGGLVELLLAGLVWMSPERQEPSAETRTSNRVMVVSRSIELPKAPPPSVPPEPPQKKEALPPPKVEPPKVSPVETLPPAQARVPAVTKSPAPKRAKKQTRKAKRLKSKRKAKAKAKVKKAAPRTLSLDNLGATSNIKVRDSQGAGDSLGDAEVPPGAYLGAAEAAEPPGRGALSNENRSTGTTRPRAGRRTLVPPKVIKRVRGVYPADAPKLTRRVPVTLSLRISDEGAVIRATVVAKPASAGNAFDKAAVAAVRRTRFKPATENGEPIPFSIRWTVYFEPP